MKPARASFRAWGCERRRPSAESGFVLPSAIFLVVILAALGGYMVALSRTSHISGALDIQGARAYQAARAGIEWAAWQVVQNPAFVCTPTFSEVASPSAVPLAGTLGAFTVEVSCDPFGPYTDGDPVTVYRVTSRARSGVPDSVDYVERQIQGSFGK